VNGADVGVIQGSNCSRFAFEPPQAIAVGRKSCGQNLDRDISPETRVAGTIDLAHSTGADETDDFVRTEARPFSQRHAPVL
jgi:hypothetical protein